MPRLIALNMGWLHAPPFPPACCHGLLVVNDSSLVLVDAGIGLADIADPVGRVGAEAIAAAGFRFLPEVTAARQIEAMGFCREDVSDIVLTHADPDHTGGLSDFPTATVHISGEERANLGSGAPRYSPPQFAHGPDWREYDSDDDDFFGVPARRVPVGFSMDVLLVPLPGHTWGHCGVALRDGETWTLHVGDAYYLRAELDEPDHPVSQLAKAAADDDRLRLDSLATVRRLRSTAGEQLRLTGYHDTTELPDGVATFEDCLARADTG